MNKKWNLYNISLARSVLMGFSALIIAFFHSYSYRFGNSSLGNILMFLRKSGNIGVDIFLILSAVGLYFSFSKNSNLGEFYKKRFVRILPSFFIVAAIYYLYIGVSIKALVNNLLLISFYINGNRDFWYFSLIIVLYLLYPLIHKVIDKYNFKGLVTLLLIIVFGTILLYNYDYVLYQRIEIALTRVPIFILGVYLGKLVLNKYEISKNYLWIFGIIFIIANLILFNVHFKYYIFVRYIYGILAMSIVFLIAYLHSIINNKYITSILEYFGLYSMEIYLIFEKLALEVRKVYIVHNNFIFYTIMFIITMFLSIVVKKICNLITDKKKNNV